MNNEQNINSQEYLYKFFADNYKKIMLLRKDEKFGDYFYPLSYKFFLVKFGSNDSRVFLSTKERNLNWLFDCSANFGEDNCDHHVMKKETLEIWNFNKFLIENYFIEKSYE